MTMFHLDLKMIVLSSQVVPVFFYNDTCTNIVSTCKPCSNLTWLQVHRIRYQCTLQKHKLRPFGDVNHDYTSMPYYSHTTGILIFPPLFILSTAPFKAHNLSSCSSSTPFAMRSR